MRFGRVHGRVTRTESCGDRGFVVLVTLEDGSRSHVVRDECLRPLPDLHAPNDLDWWADQLTQETIGTVLAGAGWEPVAISQGDLKRATTGAGTVTYVVRRV